MRNPPLQHNYAANVALVVLALFPGLINTSAIGLLSPVIGSDLGVAPDAVGRLGVCAVTSLVSAPATIFTVLM